MSKSEIIILLSLASIWFIVSSFWISEIFFSIKKVTNADENAKIERKIPILITVNAFFYFFEY